MAKPLPLPVWDRQAGKLITEWMDDHPTTYESAPQRSIRQWIKSQPIYDWLIAAYQNTHHSTREIEPFVRKYKIDMSEFEPVQYHSFAEFFDRRFRPGARKFPSAPRRSSALRRKRPSHRARTETCERWGGIVGGRILRMSAAEPARIRLSRSYT